MLSQEIDHFQAAIIERADRILEKKAGPMILDAALLTRWAEILESWIEQADGLENGVIAPAARMHPQDIANGKVKLLSNHRASHRSAGRKALRR
jgi:hypothetical protein